jgi:pantothenate kinase
MTRRIIGIAGAPGAGKTTYAEGLVADSERAGVPAAYVPMDGFHLADVALAALGVLDRKGAPETFDAWGYAALLARLRRQPDHVVWAPGFDRVLEQPFAGAVGVGPDAELVVTEGNYLLLDRPEWRAVRAELD